MSLYEMEQQRLRMLPKVPVPARLEDLHGPVEGPVTLPLRLDWSTTKTYDLSDPAMRHTMYAIVLREAKNVDDVNALLDGATLGALWKSLRLPDRVRTAWEGSFPDLGVPLKDQRALFSRLKSAANGGEVYVRAHVRDGHSVAAHWRSGPGQ